ncbi:MlaD family protein [Aeromicrobium fastidiosum]|uniref:MCE family protein n=1 Tax=Aeromicrobium fastidiosum TaxID=52699 RepID=A0A641APU8_9ACTN|nr:MlaD family protein [Aeromicrobium fastidiosum]KAA1380126.1 MCE family protein [Aeromicrobium fastidiosum]MBP2389660.1 phospholipid/cholesterol/gamma-HCH transport system substrate-binding protein [Aeromicrobium fastidiosum]
MLTTGIKAKLLAFVAVALLATAYLGARYVGIDFTRSSYSVTVALPDAAGSFENGEVTYRGVPVGRISSLTATPQGAEAVLRIDGGADKIPADVSVKVANRSAIGEQYIDLRSESTGGPTLADGDRLVAGGDSSPPPVEDVLRSARDFAGSVDTKSLTTVIDEAYDASQGAGQNLSRLLDTSQEFIDAADTNFLVTSQLIKNSSTVLATQEAAAGSIKGFSSDLRTIASTLESSDGDLRALIESTPAAARQIDKLFTQVGGPLGMLMSNLVSTAQIFGTNSAGVQDALVNLPTAFSIGWAVNGSQGLNLGLATSFFDPLPCTSGYGGTDVRPGLDTSAGRPFNTDAGCTASPSTGTGVRGPSSVPKKSGATAAVGDTGGAAAAQTKTPKVGVADSLSDLMGGAR